MIAAGFETSLLHPLSGGGATLYGGAFGDLGELTILAGLIAFLRHRNCHVRGCWRLGHSDPAHGHPACRHHASSAHLLGVDPRNRFPTPDGGETLIRTGPARNDATTRPR